MWVITTKSEIELKVKVMSDNLNNFDSYVTREDSIFKAWINKIGIKFDILKSNNHGWKNKKSKYDIEGKLSEAEIVESLKISVIKFEIKEDDFFWYSKTGNVGFDYLSAFEFKGENERLKHGVIDNKGAWVKKENLTGFQNDITVFTFGKLFNTEADINIFFVENKEKEIILLEAMTTEKFQETKEFLELNYSLKINNKSIYKSSTDTWESAAYYVNLKDSYFKDKLLNSVNFIEMVNYHFNKRAFKFKVNTGSKKGKSLGEIFNEDFDYFQKLNQWAIENNKETLIAKMGRIIRLNNPPTDDGQHQGLKL